MLCNCNHVKYWQPELLHNSYKRLKLSLISCFWASKCHEQITNSRLHQIRAGSGGWDSDKRHIFIRGCNLDHSQTASLGVHSSGVVINMIYIKIVLVAFLCQVKNYWQMCTVYNKCTCCVQHNSEKYFESYIRHLYQMELILTLSKEY